MIVDLHLHSLVSDGDLDPCALLVQAAAVGITHLAIADHDALGAYTWEGGRVFTEGRRLKLDLTIGIELDTDLEGHEVHLLGYGVSLDEGPLTRHLAQVQALRFERARREIEIVNRLLGEGSARAEDIFLPGRQTLMKPHFIHPLLDRGLFPSYGAAGAWYKQNVKSGIEVVKPKLADAIGLVHSAGGWAVMAHPGYYEKQGLAIVPRLTSLQAAGLDGVEVDYPYHSSSPERFGAEDEVTLQGALRAGALALGLRMTRGTDCHSPADFARLYGPRPARLESARLG